MCLSMLKSRLRTASSVSSLGMDEFDTRSLTSAKVSNYSAINYTAAPHTMYMMQALKKELSEELRVDIDTGKVLFAIMEKKYPKERKRAKLLAALLTYSDVNIDERAPNGMTAMHCAMRVRPDPMQSHRPSTRTPLY